MSHCCCLVVHSKNEEMDILDAYLDYYDYYQMFEKQNIGYAGLILKDGKENEYMYTAYNGKRYAYKALVNDVNWDKTLKLSDIKMIANRKRLCELYCLNKNTDNEIDFIYDLQIKNEKFVTLFDVHI